MYILRRLSFRSFCGSLAIVLLLCSLVYTLLGSHLSLLAVSHFDQTRKSHDKDGVKLDMLHWSYRGNDLKSKSFSQLSSVLPPSHVLQTNITPSSLQQYTKKVATTKMAKGKVSIVLPAGIKKVYKKLLVTSFHKRRNPVKNNDATKAMTVKTLTRETTLAEKPPPEIFQLPPIPEVSTDDTVVALPQSVIKHYLKIPKRDYRDEILILTPIHNVADRLSHYADLLKKLTYPHKLISVSFGEDCSTDETLTVAKVIVEDLKNEFKSARLFHFNLTGQITGRWSVVHDRGMQWARRKHLAKSRNLLLKSSLQKQPWVLWIDSDISQLPSDLIQQLLSAHKDVVAPCCLFNDGVNVRVYDKNTWRETKHSLEMQRNMPSNQLVLEGYGPSNRLYLPHLRAEGRVVPIDGVGGCSLLVRASCHRKGLIFPEDIYQHHIETEGLSKMAQTMGFSVYGMPFVEVYH